MKFPDVEAMTPKQSIANETAREELEPGKHYIFDPPVEASAIPTGGPGVCAVEVCRFSRGYYLGLVDGNHVFQGKPIDDRRLILAPDCFKEQLRESYFHVLFIGGASIQLDPNQDPN